MFRGNRNRYLGPDRAPRTNEFLRFEIEYKSLSFVTLARALKIV